jgi:hypothetical protein
LDLRKLMTSLPAMARGLGAWALVLAGLALIGLGKGASAASWTVAGLTFSDELGGLRLLGVSGRGTRDDPIVLVEEISGLGPATLLIRNHRGRPQRSPAVGGYLLLSMIKIVTNTGAHRWSGFELELRQQPQWPSVYTDGLSFDQPLALANPARADRFRHSFQENEPFDRLRFDGGAVDPDEPLQLRFDIVDVNAAGLFYLVQRPVVLLAERQRHRRSQWSLAPPERHRRSLVRTSPGPPRGGGEEPLAPTARPTPGLTPKALAMIVDGFGHDRRSPPH